MSRPRKQKKSIKIGPGSTFGNESGTAKRGVHSCKDPPPKNPLFLVRDGDWGDRTEFYVLKFYVRTEKAA